MVIFILLNIILLLHRPWLQVLERHIEEVSDNMIIDLAYHVRSIDHLAALIIETFLVQLLQLFNDTIIIGIFHIICGPLERRGRDIFLLNLISISCVLNWTELGKAYFNIGKAGLLSQNHIVQILS